MQSVGLSTLLIFGWLVGDHGGFLLAYLWGVVHSRVSHDPRLASHGVRGLPQPSLGWLFVGLAMRALVHTADLGDHRGRFLALTLSCVPGVEFWKRLGRSLQRFSSHSSSSEGCVGIFFLSQAVQLFPRGLNVNAAGGARILCRGRVGTLSVVPDPGAPPSHGLEVGG